MSKLQNRAATKGLVGVCVRDGRGVLVELNCETDFVARNEVFRRLVTSAASVAMAPKHEGMPEQQLTMEPDRLHPSVEYANVDVGLFNTSSVPNEEDGRSFGDLLAYSVGKLGENIKVARAICMRTLNPVDSPAAASSINPDGTLTHLVGYAHPRSEGQHPRSDGILLGRIGTLLAFAQAGPVSEEARLAAPSIGNQLSQHIIGMHPSTIGDMPSIQDTVAWKAAYARFNSEQDRVEKKHETDGGLDVGGGRSGKKMGESEASSEDRQSDSGEENAKNAEAGNEMVWNEAESRLLWQPFLIFPGVPVGEYCRAQNVEVLSFLRMQCGERISS